MNRPKLLLTASILAVCGAIGFASMAGAGGRIDTTVTIKGTGDFFGYVKSPNPVKCAKDRKVHLFKQKGNTQSPSTDEKVATDNASKSGDRYMWSVGNPGIHGGKYYARAPRTEQCKADSSKTVQAVP